MIEPLSVDSIDREILAALRENARISYRDLGNAVGLSPNAVAERVRRLVDRGVITRFTALVDPAAADRRLVALIDVQIARGTDPQAFEAELEKLDVIVEAAHLTGRWDYQLRVACSNAAELDATIRLLKAQAGVTLSDTRIVLRTAFSRPLS
jgi:Lrp/AsnC family leucine-responsive transcriptional regulator